MLEPNQELIAAWRENAIMRNPGSEKLAEMVTGTSRDEIEDSARRAAAIVADIASNSSSDNTFERARQAYGPGPTTGGGFGNVPSVYQGHRDVQRIRRENAFAEKFNNAPRDAYGQRLGISPTEVTEYTNSRFVNHVKDRLAMWGRDDSP